MGLAFSFAGSLDEALAAAERAVELEPTFPGSYWSLGWVRLERGEFAAAASALEQAVTYSARSPLLVSILGSTYAQVGRADAARQLLTELEERDTGAAYPALIYWRLGEDRRAFALLERAFEQRNAAVWMLGTVRAPASDPRRLASDPRWVALLEKHGLAAVAAR